MSVRLAGCRAVLELSDVFRPFTPDLSEPTVNENEPYLDYYTYLLSLANSDLPQVISNSYGDDERVRTSVVLYS